jgi:hypothetical protein
LNAGAKMARAAGHPVAMPKVAGTSDSGGAPILVFALPVLLLVAAGLIVSRRTRHSHEPADRDRP